MGGTGFMGKNFRAQWEYKSYNLFFSSSRVKEKYVYFDLLNQDSWQNIIDINPDFIINCIGFADRTNSELKKIYDINYFAFSGFIDFLNKKQCNTVFIHFGSIFEYDISQRNLTENSPCLPKNHYGISKLLFSDYLIEYFSKVVVLRSCNIYGLYDNVSKILPALINAQLMEKTINLSSGFQKRQFVYARDVISFVDKIITTPEYFLKYKVFNLGSGMTHSLREWSKIIIPYLPHYSNKYWNWEGIPSRKDEADYFLNISDLAVRCGFVNTGLEKSLEATVNWFYKNKENQF